MGETDSILRDFDTLFPRVGPPPGLTDGQAPRKRFTSRSDSSAEAAFAMLVERHGPMVLSRLCRRVLRDPHDAPRTPRRRVLTWSWPGVRGRSGNTIPWRVGSSGLPSESPRRPRRPPRGGVSANGEVPRWSRRSWTAGITPLNGPSSTKSSDGCRKSSGHRWCSATSRGCLTRRPPASSGGRCERSGAGSWPPVNGSGAGSSGAERRSRPDSSSWVRPRRSPRPR